MWIWWIIPFAWQRPVPQRDNRQAVFGPTKSDHARPPSVFARFSTCWFLFVPKSEISLEGAPLWLDFGHPESRDKYIKHHCKRRLIQRHPEAVWPCRSVCTVTRDLCWKLNSKSVISFMQILFIMPVLKLSRHTVFVGYWGSFLGFKCPGHDVDHLPPSSTKIENKWSYTITSLCFHGVDRANLPLLYCLCNTHCCFVSLKMKWWK